MIDLSRHEADVRHKKVIMRQNKGSDTSRPRDSSLTRCPRPDLQAANTDKEALVSISPRLSDSPREAR